MPSRSIVLAASVWLAASASGAAEQRKAEQGAAEPGAAGQSAAEQRAAEPGAAEQSAAEQRAAEQSAVEQANRGQAPATAAAGSSRARWQVVATPDDRRPRVVVLSSPERLAARGEPISLSVKDADLVEVVRSLARIAGFNLILDPSVRGTVTAELVDVPWDQALAVILRINGLAMELDGRIITVAPPARLYAAP